MVAVLIVTVMTTIIMTTTKVGPCRVLADGGCLGGLLAPRFRFSYLLISPLLFQSSNSDIFDPLLLKGSNSHDI